jgi:hypothetical protein
VSSEDNVRNLVLHYILDALDLEEVDPAEEAWEDEDPGFYSPYI